MLSPLFDSNSSHGPQLTEDQSRVLQRITTLGSLHFAGAANDCPIEPRLWPLIVGPTGCGKTHLCRLLARRLGAHYLHLSYGDWIVQGARSFCTLFAILDAAVTHQRVVVHLDELDKLPVNAEHEWTRAAANEIWALLDLELPLNRFASDPDVRSRHSGTALLLLLNQGARGRLFIIGSGTWQHIFDEAAPTKTSLGFGATVRRQEPDYIAALESIAATRGPLSELLARFEGTIQLIRPPSLAEALIILERAGARTYARHVHFDEVRVLQQLLPRQGYRALQSVVTELMLRGWRPCSATPLVAASRAPKPDCQTEFNFKLPILTHHESPTSVD